MRRKSYQRLGSPLGIPSIRSMTPTSVGIGMISTLSRHLTNRQIRASRRGVAVPPRGSHLPVNRTQCVERAIEALGRAQFGVFAPRSGARRSARHVTRSSIGSRPAPGRSCSRACYRVAVVAARRASGHGGRALVARRTGSVSHPTAARALGLRGSHERPRSTSRCRRVEACARTQVTVHHTTDLLPADVGRRGPIAVTSPLRTAIDLAGVVDAGRAGDRDRVRAASSGSSRSASSDGAPTR